MDYIFRLCRCGLSYSEAWELYTAHVSRCEMKELELLVSLLESEKDGEANVGAVRS